MQVPPLRYGIRFAHRGPRFGFFWFFRFFGVSGLFVGVFCFLGVFGGRGGVVGGEEKQSNVQLGEYVILGGSFTSSTAAAVAVAEECAVHAK